MADDEAVEYWLARDKEIGLWIKGDYKAFYDLIREKALETSRKAFKRKRK